jgi:hypothetical protein
MNDTLYSVSELSEADWFPYRERTIRKYISNGMLKALNIVTSGKSKQYRISRSEAERFINSLTYVPENENSD